jgi:hypothetical protein
VTKVSLLFSSLEYGNLPLLQSLKEEKKDEEAKKGKKAKKEEEAKKPAEEADKVEEAKKEEAKKAAEEAEKVEEAEKDEEEGDSDLEEVEEVSTIVQVSLLLRCSESKRNLCFEGSSPGRSGNVFGGPNSSFGWTFRILL